MENARKMYTSQASLCALGCYLTRQQVFEDLKVLPLPQKNGAPCALGETGRCAHAHSGRRNRYE